MSEKIELLIEATDNASSVLGGIGNTLGNLGKVAGGLALGGIAALGAGVIKFASDGLTLNNSMEKVTAQLNAFTKDGAKTAAIIETVRERAAKTPFEFDQMAKAAVALLPASKTAEGGLNGILEKAEILAASNPAQGLEGAAFALKEAVSGAFTAVIERFNLPRQFINDLKKEGVPNLEIVQRAMKEMGLDVDLVSNLANTAEGRWSTFKDTIAGVAATATKPIFDAMSNSLAGVNGLLEANTPLLNQVGATIAGVLTQGITSLSAILPPIVAAVVGFGTSIKTTFDIISSTLAPFIATIGANLTGLIPSITSIGASIQQIFGSLIPIALAQGQGAWTMISTTIQTVITSAIAILQTWLPVVQTVLAGIAAFLVQHGTEIQLLVSTAWNSITTIIQTAITTVTTIINALAPVVNEIFGAISTFLNAHGSEILGFLTTSWNSISAIVSGVAAIIQTVVTTVFGAVASFIKNHGDQIQAVLAGAWNLIKTTIGETLNIIKGIVSTVLAIINGDWDTAWKNIQSITQSSNNIIKEVIDTAMKLIEGVIKLAVDNFKLGWENGWQLMRTATDTAMTLIKDAINTCIETAKTIIANGVEAFLGKFRDLRDKMSTIGQQLLEGMVQGIRDKVGWLVDEGIRAANAVLTAIKNTLGVKSPSDETIDVAAYLMKGGAIGVKENAYLWVDEATKVANDLIYTFDNGLNTVLTNSQIAFERIAQTVTPILQLADTADSVMIRIQNSAQSMASAISASMAAAGNSISTTASQLAQFVQSGGVGGITGGTYTPSQAFQDSFKNQPTIAPPRPSSVPKPTITNNVPINITITGGNVDRYAVEDGLSAALRRSGLNGRYV